jgi:probable F420-dependent oxidoreductase
VTSSIPSGRPAAPQLSISLPSFAAEDPGTWQPLFDKAVAADLAGVDRGVVSDHVVFGEHLEEYGRPEVGGSKGGKQPTGPDGLWLEPVTTISVLAGMTTNLRLGTNILIAALRRPVTIAKSLSTLDVLSGGRIDIGVGVGWQKEEYEAAGLAFEGRGKTLDHTLEVCQTLWTEMRASYHGNGLDFDAIHQMPKPVDPTGVPIWVSGTVNKSVAQRLARFGRGWIPWGDAIGDFEDGVEQMGELVAAHGRDLKKEYAIVASIPSVRGDDRKVDIPRTLEAVPRFVDAGATDCRMVLSIPDDRSAATDYLSDVVAQFRAVVGRK